ncbi:hypothetical protein ACKWTF_004786 [Chironomus riparius]
MSLVFSIDNNCDNCSNNDKICKLAVAYRCSACNFINCMMCSKTHDNACDIFYKSNKDISIVSTSSLKSQKQKSEQKKRPSNIQDLEIGQKLLSISNSEELSSAPKKPKIMKRRCTISAGPVTVHHEKVDEILPPTFKCNTCDSDYKSKSSLARHMKTIKHAVKVKSLKDNAGAATILTSSKVDYFSSAETIVNEHEK